MAPLKRLGRFIPGAAVLRGYQAAWLRPDLLAGLTVGAMLIPQSMGYAELAGMPPEFGFYSVIAALLVYSLVGTSRHLGVGPEPGVAILAATGVAAISGGDVTRTIALMTGLALLVAAVCVVAAALRLGQLASLLAKPVLVGYITGVGLTLLSSQLAGLTGVEITAESFLPRIWQFVTNVGQMNLATTIVGATTLSAMLLLRRLLPNLPIALLGVALASILVRLLSLNEQGVALVGAIPKGLPSLGLPNLTVHDFSLLLPTALGIALVGFTDNVLTARAIASAKGYRIDPNQELLALGLINLSSGLSQGFPISSSASRTAVPSSLGSRTQLVSVVAALFVVVTLLALRPILAEIPRAALAAVIVAAAISIIQPQHFAGLWRVNPQESVLAAVSTIGVVVFGVWYGILIAVALSIGMALTRMARPHDAVLGDLSEHGGWVDATEHPTARTEAGLIVFRFDAPLFFMNAERFSDRVDELVLAHPGPVDWFVIDCEGIGELDSSGIDMLRELQIRLEKRPVQIVAVARANNRVLACMRKSGLCEPSGPLRVFPTINAAVRAFRTARQT